MFDCASVDSMKVMTRGTLKKIEKAGGKEGVEATEPKPKAAGGKKRKGKGAEEGDDAEESPKKKGKGGKKGGKKGATPSAADGKLFS